MCFIWSGALQCIWVTILCSSKSGDRESKWKAQLCQWPALWLWTNHRTYLCFGFLICKVGAVIIIFLIKLLEWIKFVHVDLIEQCLEHTKHSKMLGTVMFTWKFWFLSIFLHICWEGPRVSSSSTTLFFRLYTQDGSCCQAFLKFLNREVSRI